MREEVSHLHTPTGDGSTTPAQSAFLSCFAGSQALFVPTVDDAAAVLLSPNDPGQGVDGGLNMCTTHKRISTGRCSRLLSYNLLQIHAHTHSTAYAHAVGLHSAWVRRFEHRLLSLKQTTTATTTALPSAAAAAAALTSSPAAAAPAIGSSSNSLWEDLGAVLPSALTGGSDPVHLTAEVRACVCVRDRARECACACA